MDNKTYNTLNELKISIIENREKIGLRYCKKLVHSIKTRIEAVIKNDGV
jgi:phage-related holin